MRRRKWLTAGIAVLGLVLGGLVPGTAAAGPGGCKELEIPVAMTAGKPRDAKISGTLCRPRGRDRGVLQVLIAGVGTTGTTGVGGAIRAGRRMSRR